MAEDSSLDGDKSAKLNRRVSLAVEDMAQNDSSYLVFSCVRDNREDHMR